MQGGEDIVLCGVEAESGASGWAKGVENPGGYLASSAASRAASISATFASSLTRLAAVPRRLGG